MRRVLPLLIFLCSIQLGFSQSNFWQDVTAKSIQLAPDAFREITPTKYRTLHLKKSSIENFLASAPHSNSLDVANPLQLDIPMPNGENEIFNVVYDPVMPPVLAAKYPTTRCYMGRGLNNPDKYIRFDVTENGFHAIVKTNEGNIFVTPYAVNDVDHYMSYYTRDEGHSSNYSCGVTADMAENSPIANMVMENAKKASVQKRSASGIVERIEYKTAVSCVGEWAQERGGTVSSALADIVTSMNILNSFFTTEHAIKFTLIENNDELVYIDPATDPYVDVSNGGGLLNQNRQNLNMLIGLDNYDIGHIFTNGCSGGLGGIAALSSACAVNKANGVTCFFSSSITAIVSNVMAHEIGHQFSAQHTWNNCPGSEDQISSNSAYEPGSGSTILSYQGACSTQNISNVGNTEYFHVHSLDQVYEFSRLFGGSTCGEKISNSNNYPEITNWLYTDGFFIPQLTPFELDASATDLDGDPLTFCWEQYNTGPSVVVGAPVGNTPIFRSYPPRTASKRVFPRIETIIDNTSDNKEVLPTYSRDLNFRLTVRDNRIDGGGTKWQEVAFHTTENAGPFLVMGLPASTEWNALDYTEVTWDVANTDVAPVNCNFVNIKLSTDGGFTYPFTLVDFTPNDGSAFVTIPNVTTGNARIKIEAADNIFFDISNQNFSIGPPAETTTFATNVSPVHSQLCLPINTDITFNTFSANGFNEPVTVTILSTLPDNITPTFTNNGTAAGADINLNLEIMDAPATAFDIDFMLTAANADTIFRSVTIETLSNDFTSLALVSPVTGASGVSGTPTFEWVAQSNALTYDIQIATSPAFGPDDIVDQNVGFTNAFHEVSLLLDVNTLHYWRVRPTNLCGTGEWTSIGAFHTEALSCSTQASDNVPLNIPTQGTPVINSTITVLTDGVINDLNVVNFVGNHNLVKHIDVSLVSPAGTEVLLFSDLCGNTTTWNFGLDDDAPFEIPCPPLTQLAHQPQNQLSAFNGESTAGTWTLKLAVIDTDGEGGNLSEWALEFCSNAIGSPPFLVTNEPLVTPPSATSTIAKNLLLVEDDNNNPNELIYTIVDIPLYGTLLLDEIPVVPGTQFTQGTVNDFRFAYEQDGSNVTEDNFTFNVSDQEGGWIGILTFDINIDPNATVNTTNLENSNNITLFPNPTTNDFSILFDKLIPGKLNVEVVNIQGQSVLVNTFAQGQEVITIKGKELPAGIYVVKVTTDEGTFSDKITVYK